MSTLPLVVVASTASEPTSPIFYVVLAVGIGIAFAVIRFIGNRRNQKRTSEALAATGAGAAGAAAGDPAVAPAAVITFTTSPARPMPEGVAAVRVLIGEAGPEPRITRYTRAVVIVTTESVSLTDKKAGAFLTIPAADVASITASKVKLSPQGALPITIPAITLTVRRGDAEQPLVLAPITGLHDAVPLQYAEQLAEGMRQQLGVDPS